MGTLFGGRVDLTVDVEPGGDSVSVDVSWRDLATAPSRVVMRLRSGDGSPLREAEVDGTKVKILGGDRIELPWKPSARFRVTAAFR
jgi:hypothetical protein